MLLVLHTVSGISHAENAGANGFDILPGLTETSPPTEGRLQETPTSTPVDTQENAFPADPAGFELFEIEDPEVTQELWTLSGREGSPEPGQYQLLLYGDSPRRMMLLREGTQVGHLRETSLEALGVRLRTGSTQGSGTMTRSLGTLLVRNFWNPNDPLEPYRWDTGLEFNARMAVSAFNNSSAQVEYHRNYTLMTRPEPWLHLEGGLHMSRHGGGLHRNLYNPFDTVSGWNGWDRRRHWWHVAFGVPGFKWEIAQAGRIYAPYYWLDHEAGAGSYLVGRKATGNPFVSDSVEYRNGVVMRNWSEGGERRPERSNVSHTMHFKLGAVRYSAHFDREVYRSPIHELFFDGLSAPFGELGFGFVATRGAAHTLLRLDVAPWRIVSGPRFGNTSARLLLLRLDAAYRDPQTFHLGAGVGFRLDSPYLRLRDGDSSR